MEIKVLKWDDSILSTVDRESYLLDTSAYTDAVFKAAGDPANGWALPYVTGHTYKVHWRYGLDFTQMQIDPSPKWEETDKNVKIVFNYTDVRAKVDVIVGGKTIENSTLITK